MKEVQRGIRVFDVSFQEAFPELVDAVVEWQALDEQGHPFGGTGVRRMSDKAGSPQGVIGCGDPSCHGGGFEVELVLRRMVQEGQAEKTGIMVCSGWKGEEKPCVRSIRYRIQLTYK